MPPKASGSAPAEASSSKRQFKTSRARIKKIMQMDEDVGKLASATPVMISKSLECFLQLLVDEVGKETRKRGSKKVVGYHLKHTINTNPSFDFLQDIVSKIPDPIEATAPIGGEESGGKGKSKRNTGAPGSGGPRKKKATGGGPGDSNPMDVGVVTPGNAVPGSLPAIGTWKRETPDVPLAGRGMFDDYEDDEGDDDY